MTRTLVAGTVLLTLLVQGCNGETAPVEDDAGGAETGMSTNATDAGAGGDGAKAGACPAFADAGMAYSPSCAMCLAATCCEHAAACFADEVCATLAGCVQGCVSAGMGKACASDCLATYPDPERLFGTLSDCSEVACASACEGKI